MNYRVDAHRSANLQKKINQKPKTKKGPKRYITIANKLMYIQNYDKQNFLLKSLDTASMNQSKLGNITQSL